MASFHMSQDFFFRKTAFSRRHLESLPRMKRGRKPADSPSGIQVPRKRDVILKKRDL